MSDINQKSLDGVGRNLLPKFRDKRWTGINPTHLLDDYTLLTPSGTGLSARIDLKLEPNTKYTLTFNTDYNRWYMNKLLDDGSTQLWKFNAKGGSEIVTFETDDHTEYQLLINTLSQNVSLDRKLWDLKLEKGSKPTDWSPAPEDINFEKYVKNTRYGINKILAYYYPSVKGSEKDTYLFLNHLNNSIYTTNYKIALCLTLIENGKFNMTRFQELKSKIDHLSKYIYSLETLIRYTLENKIYIKD